MKLRNWITVLALLLHIGCAAPRGYLIVLPSADRQRIDTSDSLAKILEARWTLDRIKQITDNQNEYPSKGRQALKLRDDDWSGELHSGQKTYKAIRYVGLVRGGRLNAFLVTAFNGKKVWLLEAGDAGELFKNRLLDSNQQEAARLNNP